MIQAQPSTSAARPPVAAPAPRLSIIMEWANTRLNGTARAWTVLETIARQWQEIVDRAYPDSLPPAARAFLARLDPRAELLIASGDPSARALEADVRARMRERCEVRMLVAEGLEYYPLKNLGARQARGDLLLFLDSDVIPDDGWLAHLLGSFAEPEVDVVCGRTYVAPTDLVARAFALGWTYELREDARALREPRKFYANNIAFRSGVFPPDGFPALGVRTRGAASLLKHHLDGAGIRIWENPSAGVDHPPPSGFCHLAVRGLAHGRDIYMTRSQERNFYGLRWSVGLAARRLARGWYRTLRQGRRVDLKPWEVPAVLAIVSGYYFFFALGGVLTHLSPRAMGRRFRV